MGESTRLNHPIDSALALLSMERTPSQRTPYVDLSQEDESSGQPSVGSKSVDVLQAIEKADTSLVEDHTQMLNSSSGRLQSLGQARKRTRDGENDGPVLRKLRIGPSTRARAKTGTAVRVV